MSTLPSRRKVYSSSKVIKGFSTCFRQHKAEKTHCRFLHGYAISFNVEFRGYVLDERNWVVDFGFLSRLHTKLHGRDVTVKEWFSYWFDHTTVISVDDPLKKYFEELEGVGGLQLRLVNSAGCERFAEMVYEKLQSVLEENGITHAWVHSVSCTEHGENSAGVVLID